MLPNASPPGPPQSFAQRKWLTFLESLAIVILLFNNCGPDLDLAGLSSGEERSMHRRETGRLIASLLLLALTGLFATANADGHETRLRAQIGARSR